MYSVVEVIYKLLPCTVGTICPPLYVSKFMTEFQTKYIHPFIKHISVPYSVALIYLWSGQAITGRPKILSQQSKQKIPFYKVWF